MNIFYEYNVGFPIFCKTGDLNPPSKAHNSRLGESEGRPLNLSLSLHLSLTHFSP